VISLLAALLVLSPVSADCTAKGHRLYGRVQVVNSFPDIKVKVVDAFPDLRVRTVTTRASRCGEWQLVTSFPDLRVQFVDAFPDVRVSIVGAFPGR
jgi:hypothetical protein